MAYPEHREQDIRHILAAASSSELIIATDDTGVDINLVNSQLRFHHSFISGALPARSRQAGQAIVKACSNKQRSIKKILDLTAGWGVDSLTLAHHGKQVAMLEQNPLVFAIVAYSLERLAAVEAGAAIARQMTIENSDARDFLGRLNNDHDIDCIYLDPMFPGHKSGAKPSKEMQILQAMTGNLGIESCFEQALGKAHKRVVVKRPAKAGSLDSLKPDMTYREKTIRFDVYLTA
ncbi:MAG: class I SAM-dependent methyltransferase [Gammaproteobacteria bacterium]|nr:class I SAM-dependent methyltransferase [Gammaproteobacteria bacterium]MDH3858323.1 class I SAM-dependent methyltransferase [Gammaproteobacteria bacterium]